MAVVTHLASNLACDLSPQTLPSRPQDLRITGKWVFILARLFYTNLFLQNG